MRECNNLRLSCKLGCREVCNIACNLPRCDTGEYCIIVHKKVTREVENNHAVLHLLDCKAVNHTLSVIKKRHMNSYIVALFEYLIPCLYELNLP